MSLIYLLSSLPMLNLGAAPGVTPETFRQACRDQLSASDAATAEALLDGAPAAHPFAAAWQDKETILRNAVARLRAKASGKDAARWLRHAQGSDCQIEALAEDAFQEADPLQRERELDKIRWLAAEELQGPDPLGVRAVFAYAVKLAIATRWASLDAAQGQAVFDRLAGTAPSPGNSTPHP